MVTLQVFTDFVCPWCYLGAARVEKLKQKFEIDVRQVYFPLHPDTPAEGLSLEALFAGRGFDLEAMHARLKSLMDAEGLPYGHRTHTYNSRLAQELAKWADGKPEFESLHGALYRAYFAEGRNIGDPETLIDIAQTSGLSADAAREVLATRSFSDSVDADWAHSRRLGVTGVPTFVAGGYRVVGAQPVEVLLELLKAAGAEPRD
jgi:predicted DsbA family dithiol-disulfide isomerase